MEKLYLIFHAMANLSTTISILFAVFVFRDGKNMKKEEMKKEKILATVTLIEKYNRVIHPRMKACDAEYLRLIQDQLNLYTDKVQRDEFDQSTIEEFLQELFKGDYTRLALTCQRATSAIRVFDEIESIAIPIRYGLVENTLLLPFLDGEVLCYLNNYELLLDEVRSNKRAYENISYLKSALVTHYDETRQESRHEIK